jgi:ribonucleotide monophosphatase NagD (HAD superfamily)
MGIQAAAMLTGITSREEIERKDIKPDFIFEDITALLRALSEVYSA